MRVLTAKFIRPAAFALFCALLAAVCAAFFVVGRKNAEDTPEPVPEVTKKYEGYPTVIIDAGHGGEDGGAIGVNGALEKHVNLAVALELEALLVSEGIDVRLTRREDTLLYDRNADYEGQKKRLDMAARLAVTEEYTNAVFISIHMNSFPEEKYRGLQVYYSEGTPLSRELATIIETLIVRDLQPDNKRKSKPSGGIFLLDEARHPAVLVECGFLSNREECELLCDEGYRKRLCLVIFSAVVEYFDTNFNNRGDCS